MSSAGGEGAAPCQHPRETFAAVQALVELSFQCG